MATGSVIPDFKFPPPAAPAAGSGMVPRGTLKDSASEVERVQITVAAAGELEQIVYGRQRLGARIGWPVDYQNTLVVPCYLGVGEIDAIESLEIDNAAAPSGVTRADYTGTTGQTVNATLVAAWAAKGKVFSDAHVGKAYSVVRFPAGQEYGFNSIAFIVRGLKVYDPRKVCPSLRVAGSPETYLYMGGGSAPAQQQFGTGSFTVEGWFYHDAYGSPASFFPVSAFGTPWNGAAGWGFGAVPNANGLYISIHDGVAHLTKTLTHENGYRPSQLTGQWVHVAVVLDRAEQHVRVLINGIRQTDVLSFAGSPTFGSISNSNGFRVGDAEGATLDGRFAELRMWNTARTDNEVRDAMYRRAAGNETGLVACYPLDEGSGSTANDITSYNADKTFSAGPNWGGRGPDIGPASNSIKAYSANPALCLADLITNSQYGMGTEIDWPSFAALADIHDGTVGTPPNTEALRTLNITLNRQQRTEQWVETLRSYAGCWLPEVDGRIKAVPDEARSVDMALVAGSYRLDSLRVKRPGPENVPSVVTVRYTDTAVTPWNTDATQQIQLAGVDAGTVPYRESLIEWPGCNSAGMAYREAYRRLRQGQLCDLNCDIVLLDDAIRLHEGDVVSLTDTEGFTAKQFRVVGLSIDELGRPTAKLSEYDPNVYSTTVVAGPTSPDTTLPSPNSPLAPTALVLSEELVQRQGSGLYDSRIVATWTAPSYPFVQEYRVEVTQASIVKETGTARDTEYQSGPLKEGVAYAVNVYTVSTTGKTSSVLQGTITLQGKDDVPSNVQDFAAREIGGKVFFDWSLVTDLDNAGYEIRYALQSLNATWDEATLLDTVPTRSARYATEGFPAGDWRFYIKARDGKRTATYPGGQYSATASTVDIAVSLDTSLFLSERHVFGSETLENMTEYTTRPVAANYFVTDFRDTLGYGHSDPNNATGTFADLLGYAFCVPHSAPGSPTPDSIYTTEAYDFGVLLNATWRAELVAYNQDPAGPAPTTYILTSSDGSTYTAHEGEQWSGEARFVKLQLRCPGGGTMLVVRNSTTPAVVIDAVSRTEDGTVTTSATNPVTVTLTGLYTRVKSIQVTPTGATAQMALYDNVQLSQVNPNTFDVYAFDDTGNQIETQVSYTFKGV